MSEERKIERAVTEVVSRLMDIWIKGEGDLIVEVRDDKGEKKVKIKGGSVERI